MAQKETYIWYLPLHRWHQSQCVPTPSGLSPVPHWNYIHVWHT